MNQKRLINVYKIVVLGSSGVGKTAIVQRLTEGIFREESQSTVGVEFKTYICPLINETVKLQIWDTAGQERFRSVSKAYFRNAIGAILVYDVTDEASFESLESWLHDLQQLSHPNAYVLLVGNKSDLKQRSIGEYEAKNFAMQHFMEYIETSAFSGENINETFIRLAAGISKRIANGQIEPPLLAKPSPFRESEFYVQEKEKCC
ncbi:Ras family protein [Histomonas meleagridis]|uniref:Ras family protein n=1 Tax=Histomonas meleagridis TaxID=135588 RepID=UPI00355952FF|nr:Ras family protein [Histomonas meleagridis]KAH0801354.1 Ras family protein [Histomonas meleagridis]